MPANLRILVIDDDEFTREVLRELLEPYYDVELAADGMAGVKQALASTPDLILSDIQMPLLDGFGVVAALRAKPQTAQVPFVFLSAGYEADVQRKGMSLGANDYLTKPVRRSELIRTVNDRLRRGRHRRGVRDDAGAPEASSRSRESAVRNEAPVTGMLRQGAVLHVSIRGFDALARRLSNEQVGKVLGDWHVLAAQKIENHNGWLARSTGDSILALFDDPRERSDNTTQRALRACFGLLHAASEFRKHLRDSVAGGLGMHFSIGLALHHGQVTLAKRSAGAGGAIDIVGEAVETVDNLRRQAGGLGWTLSLTDAAADLVGDFASFGRSESAGDGRRGGRQEIVELLGPDPDDTSIEEIRRGLDIRRLIAENDQARDERPLRDATAVPAGEKFFKHIRKLTARSYDIIRPLGGGGMSQVYLARERRSGELQALKFLVSEGQSLGVLIRQFLDEYALISHIVHPQVAMIHDQWFADDLACIAMEYFPRGELRAVLHDFPDGMPEQTVLAYIRQIATGLAAIHAAGIVHRDMKPHNVMLRVDGTVAISDFGIARRLSAANAAGATGAITGTAYYVSPEQAAGRALTPASDIYSLGIMFYELLTGKKPYTGASVASILAQHKHAPSPVLPERLARYQPVLDRMTAKNPAERFSSALTVIAALDA